nr:immunoglobulin heavy chain junction region [Mus musculus]
RTLRSIIVPSIVTT